MCCQVESLKRPELNGDWCGVLRARRHIENQWVWERRSNVASQRVANLERTGLPHFTNDERKVGGRRGSTKRGGY